MKFNGIAMLGVDYKDNFTSFESYFFNTGKYCYHS